MAEAALADTLEAVAQCCAERKVLALSGRPGSWLPEGFELIDQRGATFGDRLANAWVDAAGPGFQIGMDTPQVTVSLLDAALDQIAGGAPAILGRATDGGWWGIGFQGAQAGVFDGVGMSRSDTASQQAARCATLGLDIRELAELRDVDTWADALVVAAEVPASRFAAAVRSCGKAAAPSDGPLL